MKRTVLMLVNAALLSAALFLNGCEGGDDPDDSNLDRYFADNPYVSDPRGNSENPVAISPDNAFVTVAGEQIAFRATGGTGPYTWDVAIPANGSIDASANWRMGVYTANRAADNSIIVYDRDGYAAIASVGVSESGADLAASAAPTSLSSDGDKSVVTATGGRAPYTWSVHDVALGNIDSTSGNSVLYTRYNSGDNSVNVVDQNGDSVYMIIEQP